MLGTKKMLIMNKSWSEVYQSQIQDMLDQGVARKVPEMELVAYNGPVNYLPNLAVQNPKSQSPPVRICFYASEAQ